MTRLVDSHGDPLRRPDGLRLGTCEHSRYRHPLTTPDRAERYAALECKRWVPTGSIRALLLRRRDPVTGRVR